MFEAHEDDLAVAAHRNSEHFQTLVAGKIVSFLEAREADLATELVL